MHNPTSGAYGSCFINSERAVQFQHPLTERADDALRQAQQVAQDYAHEYLGTEHLLLGLLEHTSGDIPALLRSAGIDPNAVPTAVARTVRRGNAPDAAARTRPYTTRTQHVLQVAGEEAATHGEKAVDLLHLLLALRLEEKGIAAQILAEVGLQAEIVRQALDVQRDS